jgi:ABC-type glutathione transport system ATPase component
MLSLFLQAGAYILLMVLIELNLITRVVKYVSTQLDLESVFAPPRRVLDATEVRGGEDDDVAAERVRVMANDEDDGDIVVLKDISKVYKMPWCSGEVEAVQGLSMGVGRGECFGLLGVNGAGKTSTFKMLTGDESISGGTALINGFDAASNMNAARKYVNVPCSDRGGDMCVASFRGFVLMFLTDHPQIHWLRASV